MTGAERRWLDLDFKKDVLPFLLATGGEFAALYYWLQLYRDDRVWLAMGVLWAGFLVERLSVVAWLTLVYRPREAAADRRPLWKGVALMLGVTLSEILIWVSWLWLVGRAGHLVGGVYLLALMQLEHAVEMSILKRTPPLAHVTDGRTFFFTLMEVLGAAGWLWFVLAGEPLTGAAILLVGLSVEHVIQGSGLKPEPGRGSAAPGGAH